MTTIVTTSKERKARERKIALLEAGVRLTDIAAATGYSLQQVSAVNLGHRRCEPIEAAIADACQKTRESMFDDAEDA